MPNVDDAGLSTPPEKRLTQPVVHKFGGSSLGDATRFVDVLRILGSRPASRRVIVVSAIGGVTDDLVQIVAKAGARDSSYREDLELLRQRHLMLVAALLEADVLTCQIAEAARSALACDLDEAADVLRAAWVLRHCPAGAVDMISGLGELWSARLLAACLTGNGEDVEWLDARQVLVVEKVDGRARVDWVASRQNLSKWRSALARDPETLVVTGFIAASPEGAPTTLGRNGSDFSASIFGALFDASEINIWTDVDGVRSADPRMIPEAVHLETLSYNEAIELAHFGSRVLHPATMGPAVELGIPIYIRNTFRPDGQSTRIDRAGGPENLVKGLSLVAGVALINVEGTALSESLGIAHRLFGAIKDRGIDVLLVTQGSSQHSICFAVPAALAERAKQLAEAAFFAERHQGTIQTVDLDRDCAMLTVVGDGMGGHPGVAAQFFGALGEAGINIRAIAQGSSERNISVVVSGDQGKRALRAAHSALYLSRQTLSVGLVGAGVVGSALLDQLARQVNRARESGLDLRVRAIATRSRMVLHDQSLPLATWRESLASGGPFDMDRFIEHVQTDYLPHTVLIDCTADEGLARRYGEWLHRGIHVVTPNKKGNTLELSYYNEIREACRVSKAHYLYEATVGAGLPIIQTLRDLVRTGDEVLKIEGVFSGTLSYLFNKFDGTRPFSELVADARRNGFTEPDPRDDLSGMDVVRKIVILAREMGQELEVHDVALEGLVPEDLQGGSVEAFLEGLRAYDDRMTDLYEEAVSHGEVLRFIGSIGRDGRSEVRLRRVSKASAFARLTGTDNLATFETCRYTPNPLVVQGPGAGPDVTAGGIFADLLRLAAYLGGRS